MPCLLDGGLVLGTLRVGISLGSPMIFTTVHGRVVNRERVLSFTGGRARLGLESGVSCLSSRIHLPVLRDIILEVNGLGRRRRRGRIGVKVPRFPAGQYSRS